mgnify:CR=1 FL=1
MLEGFPDIRGAIIPSPMLVVLTLLALAVSATMTAAIGIHAVFGAFILGAVIPHESRLARALTR